MRYRHRFDSSMPLPMCFPHPLDQGQVSNNVQITTK